MTAEEAPLLEKPEGKAGDGASEGNPSRTLATLLAYSAQDTPLLSLAFAAGERPLCGRSLSASTRC